MQVTTLPEVRERLELQSKGVWDAVLEPREMTLVQGRLVSPRLYRYEYPRGLAPTVWATGQLCQFLGVPAAYFRRCPPPLQDAQANFWLQDLAREHREQEGRSSRTGNHGNQGKSERWLLRARGDVLRGVLTERYTRLDHLELYEALAPALQGGHGGPGSDYQVDWFALTDDDSFHLRLHDARQHRDALPGDRLMAGVHIANSEVGKRAVTVDALVYRLVCTNGLIRKVGGASLLHQRHIALSRPEFTLAVRQAVRDAFAQSAAFLDRLAASVAHPLPDVERVLHRVAQELGLTQTTAEAVKKAMLLEHPSQHETLYGLINGLTGVARGMGADERYALEAHAGRLLESPPSYLLPPSRSIPTLGGTADVGASSSSTGMRRRARPHSNGSGPSGSVAAIASDAAPQPDGLERVGLFAM